MVLEVVWFQNGSVGLSVLKAITLAIYPSGQVECRQKVGSGAGDRL